MNQTCTGQYQPVTGVVIWPTLSGGNGHGYKLISNSSSIVITNVMNQCAGYASSTFKSYLVTFDSKQEWDFLLNSFEDDLYQKILDSVYTQTYKPHICIFKQITCLIHDSTTLSTLEYQDYNFTIRVAEMVGSKLISIAKECTNNCSGHGICNRIFEYLVVIVNVKGHMNNGRSLPLHDYTCRISIQKYTINQNSDNNNNNNNNIVAVLVLLLFYIHPIHGQYDPITGVKVWPTSKGGNGNGYRIIQLDFGLNSVTDAIIHCEGLGFGSSTFKSYLVSVDSYQEWDFIKTSWPIVRVSGRDIGGSGNYTYSTGPQTNQPLFNMYTGQCWGYCPFEAGEPSLVNVGVDQYIYIRGPKGNFNHDNGFDVPIFICELELISEVYIPSIGTNGGSITINNLTQFNIQTINITFFNPTKQLSKSCHITSKQATSVTCTVPPLSGFHNVIVQDDSGVNSTHYAWQPYPPFIKAVYPSFTANGSITLIGDNFGDNTNNQVAANVSTSDIPCNIMFASSTQIICQLKSSLGDTKLLPISISVDSVYTQTYKPHIFCDNRFHSTILFGGEYSRVEQLMIDNVTMGATPNAPYIGAIESQEMYQCFSQSLNLTGYETFRFWQGVSFNSNNGSFTRNNGPFKGTISPLYYNTTVTSNMTQSNNIIYNIFDRTLSSNIENVNYYTPLITFYTSDAPIIDNVTNIIPGYRSLVTINGNHFGQDQSYVLVSINGSQCKSPQFIGSGFRQFTCLLDDSTSGSRIGADYNVTIRVAEMVTSKMVVVSQPSKECLHNCSGHGVCNRIFGSCKCDVGYESYLDCSLVTPDQLYNTTVWNNGTTTLSTNQTNAGIVVNFTTGIQYIREIDQDNSITKTISMDNVTWIQGNKNETSTVGESIFIGTIYHNPHTQLHIRVNQYIDTNTISFLGEDIQVSPNSIKYTVKIIDWVWSSPINTLQVIFHSKSDSVEYDSCGVMKVKSEVSPGDQIVWTRVQVGRSLLNCKIASRMIIDNNTIISSRVTILPNDDTLFSSQQIDNQGYNLLTVFNIPQFSGSVELDPSFNALIVGDDFNIIDSQCDSDEKSFSKWKIITITVCLSFVVISIILVTIIVSKQLKTKTK
ncbi:hypothetical protein DFA_02844 [Cavenderia fasciculata]|uniref:EGF-like domain-containing protein n=1 Tax=Cavenderia fasciculata TaxID=261658 RepID=F4PIM1_CACFS|nr:uncharacterized protein DFA_02844 [Cavenderia fasciculata]EGG24601.1 hypothetical protein DFA_02844 [Cavenderia fasciculata]|eukprot:XP_004362452.1 hypothetical protein DFA_02844 [Cavenderia fasciculata]